LEQLAKHPTDFMRIPSGTSAAMRLSNNIWPGFLRPSDKFRPFLQVVQTSNSTLDLSTAFS